MREKILSLLESFELGAGGNLVSLDIVRALHVDGAKVSFVLEAPSSDIAQDLESRRPAIRKTLLQIEGLDEVSIVVTSHSKEPPKLKIGGHPKRQETTMKPQSVSKIIAIASGKGGVGKSTVSSNLAVALADKGKKIGLLDADIYGPSQPRMMGVSQRPSSPDGKSIIPLQAHGVTMMSIGLMVDPSKAVVWRGPMLMGALQQMLSQVEWGKLDALIVDLPPGTGDVQLTLCQRAELSGAIIVSTPQDVALLDARKAIDMFKTLKTPILGMIENMSNFVCPNCNHETPIFGNGGVLIHAKELQVPLLGALPIDLDTRLAGDNGKPAALLGGSAAIAYGKIADGFIASGLI